MCGISGILRFNGRPVIESEIIDINNRQQHRGKDSAKTVCGAVESSFSSYPGIALGHRRLSIIDLEDCAAQPMSYSEARYWITYNGELFNYQHLKAELGSLGHSFHTKSDTEVILASYAQWGPNCLTRFKGMFAFAIWNNITHTLFCARDAIGIKPFYFKLDENEFVFASESQALSGKDHFSLDKDALYSFIFSMYVPCSMSIFENVKKLLPGTYAIVDTNGQLTETKYWTIPGKNNVKLHTQTASQTLLHALDKSVAAQMISDVPVGAFLSGGFDSGMIVASASLSGIPLHTYSAGYDDGEQYNELPIAKALAKKYGTIHNERTIVSGEIINILDKALSSMSEPVADSAIVPTYCLAEMAGSDGVKVLLSGTGGDEVLGGYSRYIGYNLARYTWLKTPSSLKAFLGKYIIQDPAMSKRLQSPELDMMMLTGGCANLTKEVLGNQKSFEIFLNEVIISSFPKNKKLPSLYRNMYFDLQVYVPDLLLYTLDQLTMASTVEGRVPLLDPNFIAESYNMHPSMHVNGTRTRLMMREMAKDRLDPATLTAKKQGFSGPVKHWIKSNEKVFKERVMAVNEIPFLENLNLNHYWTKNSIDNAHTRSEIFLLFCLSTWYQNKKNE